MRRYPIAFIALLLASPALAGPREDATCIVGKLSDADVATIVAESTAGGSNEAVARLTPPLDVCSEGQNWTPRRRADAAGYAIGLVDSATLGQRLVAKGIDTAALDRWFIRQSLEFRTTAFLGMSEDAMTNVFETLADHEVPAATLERDGPLIGGYLAAHVIMERIERGIGLD
jgi:hypothetical protein